MDTSKIKAFFKIKDKSPSGSKTKDETAKKEENIKYKQKNAVGTIKKDTPVFVVETDINRKEIIILSMIGSNFSTIAVDRLPYKTRALDEEFFSRLEGILNNYLKDKPSQQSIAVYIVLPNKTVANDLINIPVMKKAQVNSSLDITLNSSYKNRKELLIKPQILVQNKQYITYYVLSIKKNLLASFFSTLANCKMYAKYATYTSNALINAVFSLKPKNKAHTFLFIDIKQDITYFAYCLKGKTIGHYNLQFGYKFLEAGRVAYENMLSDHSTAEIAVLNAQEKAKAKQLTMMGGDNEDSDEKKNDNESKDLTSDSANAKILGKKVPKKLPKFMQRDYENTEEGILYENFRIFVKWALLVLSSYDKKGLNTKPEYVLVNMPEKYNSVLQKVNEEAEENGIVFQAFNEDLTLPDTILENLELYGALFMGQFNKNQVF